MVALGLPAWGAAVVLPHATRRPPVV